MKEQLKLIIIGYVSWIWYYLYRPYRNKVKEDAKRRIKICESCEYFNITFRNCQICGCLMDVKTRMIFPLNENGIAIGGCIKQKW